MATFSAKRSAATFIFGFVILAGATAQGGMIAGAIGNDGSGGFDGSMTAIASSAPNPVAGRTPSAAINGAGIVLAAGGDANNRNDYEHDAGGSSTGDNINWMAGKTTGWLKIDLGQLYLLDEAFFFNFNPNGASGNEDRGVQQECAQAPSAAVSARDQAWSMACARETRRPAIDVSGTTSSTPPRLTASRGMP